MFFFLTLIFSLKDTDQLVTEELVNAINSDPTSTFHAKVYPQFAKMTVGDAKKFLSPVRPIPSEGNRGSPVPVGANENWMHHLDKNYITGLGNRLVPGHPAGTFGDPNTHPGGKGFKFPIYNVVYLCSSWAPAVTSAMSISFSRWNTMTAIQAKDFINFSLQYILDCDLLGDACVERTPLSAYQIFWSRQIPTSDNWDNPGVASSERASPLDPPRSDFVTQQNCLGCYPGLSNCGKHYVLTGSCNNNMPPTGCPVYMLYNWRWMKSHLFEVGAITSSILCHQHFFSYSSENDWIPFVNPNEDKSIYSRSSLTQVKGDGDILGMLDVTIVGWGQQYINLSTTDETTYAQKNRWWWVIPHLGCSFGTRMPSGEGTYGGIFIYPGATNGAQPKLTHPDFYFCSHDAPITSTDPTPNGFVKFNRRYDDCNIESHSVGAVPFNFVPLPYRSPGPTY